MVNVIYLFYVLLLFAVPEDQQSIKAKFSVTTDKPEVEKLYIAGDFTKWKIVAMDRKENFWVYEKLLPSNSSGKYTYLLANDWEAREEVSGACFAGTDRLYEIGTQEKEFQNLLGSCYNLKEYKSHTLVTFELDTKRTAQEKGTFYIAGDFTEWKIEPLEKKSGGKYVYRSSIPLNTTGKYFYLNGQEWSDREPIPGNECAQGKDRVFKIESKKQVFKDVFGDCE